MENKNVKLLIVDDSKIVREVLKHIFTSDPEINVVGMALNGEQAVQMTAKLKPDIITMDIEMPVMNGLLAIDQIMHEHPTPILVLTSYSSKIDNLGFNALSKGALDIIDKPDINDYNRMASTLINQVKLLSKIKVIRRIKPISQKIKKEIKKEKVGHIKKPYEGISMVAVASSTGGPVTLNKILTALPKDFIPITIVQHINEGFTEGLVKWLNLSSTNKVKIAQEGEILKRGMVYVAPENVHMVFDKNGIIRFQDGPSQNGVKPSADMLFKTAGEVFKDKAIGVILSGMGSDGAKGMKTIKLSGGTTIAQNEESCVVFGMPKVAIEMKAIDYILSVNDIIKKIIELCHEFKL